MSIWENGKLVETICDTSYEDMASAPRLDVASAVSEIAGQIAMLTDLTYVEAFYKVYAAVVGIKDGGTP